MSKPIESSEIIARSRQLTPSAPWAPGDELGMANAIGPGTWLRCAPYLMAPGAKCYELGHPLSSTMPSSPFGKPLKFQARPTRGIRNSRHASNMEEMLSGEPGAQGTHMDALGHFGAVDRAWDGASDFPADAVRYYGSHRQSDVKPTPDGMLAKLGIDKAAPIVTTAVLLDAQRFLGNGKPLDAGYAVSAADIETMLSKQGLGERGILPGDVLYIHTGWGARWIDPDLEKIYYSEGPGLGYDAARLAEEKGVVLVALDNPFTDAVKAGLMRGEAPVADGYPADLPFAIHHHLLTQAGIHQIQNAKLDELARDRVWTSCTIILPLRCDWGCGLTRSTDRHRRPAKRRRRLTLMDAEYDVVVVGSGAAGCTAALIAAHFGLEVVIVEKTAYVGGSTAISGGAIWIPQTRYDVGADDRSKVMAYLQPFLNNHGDPATLETFLDEGPKAIEFLEQHTALRFQSRPLAPDYRAELPGAALKGRTIDVVPFDGRQLGDAFSWIRPPTREFLAFGGMMVNRRDINALLGFTSSWADFRHSLELVSRFVRDRLRYERGTRLVMGNGLSARLLKSVLDAKIELRRETEAKSLIAENGGGVSGIVVQRANETFRLRARRGVVLATGGFPADKARTKTLLPYADCHRTVAPGSNMGDGIRLGVSVGGRLAEDNVGTALLAPVSVFKADDGTETVFPHLILDRQKPGLVAVDRNGKRFVNEACSYHDFVLAMYAHDAAVPAHLICDRRFLWRYGLGLVKPRSLTTRRFIDAGYLLKAPTIKILARRIGIDETVLTATIARNNDDAISGCDPAFHKGVSPYDRHLGDPAHGPQPVYRSDR